MAHSVPHVVVYQRLGRNGSLNTLGIQVLRVTTIESLQKQNSGEAFHRKNVSRTSSQFTSSLNQTRHSIPDVTQPSRSESSVLTVRRGLMSASRSLIKSFDSQFSNRSIVETVERRLHVRHLDRRGTDEHDEDSGEDEKNHREQHLNGRLLRLFFGHLTSFCSHGVRLNSKSLRD